MKWFLLIIFSFCLIWVFLKDKMPNAIKDSSFADFSNSVLYPVEYQLSAFIPALKNKNQSKEVIEVNSTTLIGFIKKLQKSSKNGFLFFQDDTGIVQKSVISGIGQILDNKPELAKRFVIISVGEEQNKFQIFINSFRNPKFRAFFIKPKEFTTFKNYFASHNDEKIRDMPISFYKSKNSFQYDEISTGFFTKARIEQLIEADL